MTSVQIVLKHGNWDGAERYFQGGVNKVYRRDLVWNKARVPGLFKLSAWESNRAESVREAVVYWLANLTGLVCVPQGVLREVTTSFWAHSEELWVQELVEGGKTYPLANGDVDPRDAADMVVFDTLTANGDRHGGNMLLVRGSKAGYERRLVAIDHGFTCRNSDTYLHGYASYLANQLPGYHNRDGYELTETQRGAMRLVLDHAKELQALVQRLGAGHLVCVPGILARAEKLARLGAIA